MHQGRHSGELARQAVTVDRMMTLAFGGQARDHQHRHILRGDAFQQLIDIGAGGDIHAARRLIDKARQAVTVDRMMTLAFGGQA
jgi:hypothetical protein